MILQPDFAVPTTLSATWPSESAPPKLWRKTTAWSVGAPRSGSAEERRRFAVDGIPKSRRFDLSQLRAAADADGALMPVAT